MKYMGGHPSILLLGKVLQYLWSFNLNIVFLPITKNILYALTFYLYTKGVLSVKFSLFRVLPSFVRVASLTPVIHLSSSLTLLRGQH